MVIKLKIFFTQTRRLASWFFVRGYIFHRLQLTSGFSGGVLSFASYLRPHVYSRVSRTRDIQRKKGGGLKISRDPHRLRKASGELTRRSPDMSRKRDGNEKVTLRLAHSLSSGRFTVVSKMVTRAHDDKSRA